MVGTGTHHPCISLYTVLAPLIYRYRLLQNLIKIKKELEEEEMPEEAAAKDIKLEMNRGEFCTTSLEPLKEVTSSSEQLSGRRTPLVAYQKLGSGF